jgi:hypothetical protein
VHKVKKDLLGWRTKSIKSAFFNMHNNLAAAQLSCSSLVAAAGWPLLCRCDELVSNLLGSGL